MKIAIGVYLALCTANLLTAQSYYLTADAVRPLKDGTDQHIQALTFANGETSIPIKENMSITWDGVLRDHGLPFQEGPDMFPGIKWDGTPNTMYRQLPAAEVGQTVPVPFYDVVTKIWRTGEGNAAALLEKTRRHRVHVPQVIMVMFVQSGHQKFIANVMGSGRYADEIAVSKSGANIATAAEFICNHLRQQFPPDMNVRVVNAHAPGFKIRTQGLNGNVKRVLLTHTVTLPPGNNNTVGYTNPSEVMEGNGKRDGTCVVLFGNYEDLLRRAYNVKRNPPNEIPAQTAMYTYEDFLKCLATSVLHEVCHLMGLVSKEYLQGINEDHLFSHNIDENPPKKYVMNKDYSIQERIEGNFIFKNKNIEYLEFILPKPQPQGN